jgi:curved DNA-binding protein
VPVSALEETGRRPVSGLPDPGKFKLMATGYRDYYATLGVGRTATQKEIKAAYRKAARKHHPDVNPNNPEAEARFKELNEANEVLSDPEKRKKYDQYGADWQAWERAGAQGGAPPFAGAGFQPGGFGRGGPAVEYRTMSAQDMQEMFGDADPFSDFFHSMFGSRTGAGRGRAPRAARSAALRGGDVEGDATISLEEAYTGTTRRVELAGDARTRRVEVRIPPGIRDGARVRAVGQGGAGGGGGDAGDLYIRVRIEDHPLFRREGDNVRARVEVPLDVALLGGDVQVPTLKGTRVSLSIPAETQNGKVMRLRGLGMPKLKGSGHGDLLAEVDVRLPFPLTPEVKALAEAIRDGAAGSTGRNRAASRA